MIQKLFIVLIACSIYSLYSMENDSSLDLSKLSPQHIVIFNKYLLKNIVEQIITLNYNNIDETVKQLKIFLRINKQIKKIASDLFKELAFSKNLVDILYKKYHNYNKVHIIAALCSGYTEIKPLQRNLFVLFLQELTRNINKTQELCQNNNDNIDIYLLNNFISIASTNNGQYLINAVIFNNLRALRLLLDNGICPNTVDANTDPANQNEINNLGYRPTTALKEAICNKKTEASKILLSYNAHIDSEYIKLAIANGDCEILNMLLNKLIDKGIDINNIIFQNNENMLLQAASMGHVNIVELLLSKKINIKLESSNKNNVFHYAINYANYLKRLFVDEFTVNNGRIKDSLSYIIRIIKLIDSYKLIDINSQNNSGNTPLHLAAFTGYQDLITLLISLGARTDIPNNDNLTAESMIN